MQELFLKIYGRVQGVFFRSETKKMAENLNLCGWVKNVDDGTVEILAQGEVEKLKQLENWARQGSNLARVEKVDVDYREIKKPLDNFKFLVTKGIFDVKSSLISKQH